MKRIVLILIAMLIATPAHAINIHRKSVESARTAGKVLSIPVLGTAATYTRSFPIYSANSELQIGVVYRQTPATGDTKLQFEQSAQKPTTEGAADSTYLVTHNLDTSITGTQWEQATIDTVDMMYGRFVITGQNSNPDSTVAITIKYVK